MDPSPSPRRTAAGLLVLALLSLAGTTQADHRPDTDTELTASAADTRIGPDTPAEVELQLVYRYPSYVPSVEPTETRLDVETASPVEVEVEPTTVPHGGVSNPAERDPGTEQEQTATIVLRLAVPEAREEGEALVTLHANTTGTRTLDSSRDQANVTAGWTIPGSDGAEDGLASAATSDEAGATEEAGVDDGTLPVPVAGPVVLLLALAAAAARTDRGERTPSRHRSSAGRTLSRRRLWP